MTKDFRDRVYQHIGYARNNIQSRSTEAHFNLPGHGRKFNTFYYGLNKEPYSSVYQITVVFLSNKKTKYLVVVLAPPPFPPALVDKTTRF